MLKNKIVVVTGGLGLIGRAFCKSIRDNNGIAIDADISNKEYNLDINSKESINVLINKITDKYAKIDAWVNCAYPRNKNYGNHFFDVELDDFNDNVSLSLGGYFLCSQQISKYFIKQGHGNIINISSIYGVIAPRFEIYDATDMTIPVEYSVIKSGLIHFSKYLAKYLKGKNIRVNCISPGGIFDNQPKSFIDSYNEKCLNKGMLDTIDLCGTLVFLLSDNSIYINGQNIVVDDGFIL